MAILTVSNESGVEVELDVVTGYSPRVSSGDDRVTEPIEVFFSDMDEGRQKMNVLNRLFQEARHNDERRLGEQVHVYITPSEGEEAYRSRIFDGRVEWRDNPLSPWWVQSNRGKALILWERQNFWEGEQVEIPLSNEHATATLGGVTVYNHDDEADSLEAGSYAGFAGITYPEGTTLGGEDNWVRIDALDVEGDLPAPIRLEIRNNYSSATRANDFWVAHNVYSSPNGIRHVFEGEDATATTTSSVLSSSASSNGEYRSLTWDASVGEVNVANWELPGEFLRRARGNAFRALMRVNSAVPSNTKMKLVLKLSLTTIWESEQIAVSSSERIIDLGSLFLPPQRMNFNEPVKELTLHLLVERDAETNTTIYIDFLHLVALDGWRKLVPNGYNLAQNVTLVLDEAEGLIYAEWPEAMAHYLKFGRPIVLIPGRDQKIYFLHDTATGVAPIERTLQIQAFYRPRRSSL